MTEYTDRQIALEGEMAERGRERQRAGSSRLRQAGRESLTGPGRRVIRASMGRMVAALEEWAKAQKAEHSTRQQAEYAAFLQAPPPKVLALLTLRHCLDAACSERTWQSVVHGVGRAVDEERAARWLAKESPGLWATAQRRAASVPERAASRLRKDVRQLMKVKDYPRWPMGERLRLAGFLVQLAADRAGVFALERVRLGRRRAVTLLRALPETAEWLARASSTEEALEPLYLPMVDVPGDWGPDLLGGYATPLIARQHLVKNRSRATRERVAGADMPAVYSAVNALQRTAWEINPDVLETARHLFQAGRPVPGLEGADDEAMPARPEVVTADWMRRRFLVRRGNLFRSSRRTQAARVLWLAGRMAPEGRFHFPQQLDFRGRTYPVPQYLQPQGPDLARGLLRFADGEYITPDTRWFWIHGANCLGLDKARLDDRVRATLVYNRQSILAVAHDPIENIWWQEAAEPWQFLAWCLEAGELLETGRVLTRVPCYVDGTNNGLQILSLLLRDEVGGAATNCIPGDTRRDVYQDVADEVTRRLRDVDDDLARGWLAWLPNNRLPRAATKRSVMTLPYGCTPYSSRQYVLDWFEEELRQGRPNPWDKLQRDAVWALANHLWAAIEALLGRALGAMRWLKDAARACVDAGVQPTWSTPSGFPVRQSYTNASTAQVRTKLGERVRWVRSQRQGNKPNRRRHVNGLAPNFVHSLDAAVLMRVVSRFGDQPVSTIHDSFGTTAGRLGELQRLVREEYAAVFSADLLGDLHRQIAESLGGRYSLVSPPPRGTLDPTQVAHSDYLFS